MPADEFQACFQADGFVRLRGAFTADQAGAMRDAVWRHAGRQAGLRPDDPASWTGSPVVNWQGLRRDPVFAPVVENQPVRQALDMIFGPGGWRRPRPGAQILFSLPQPGPWVLPDDWHMDCGFEQPAWPVRTVKLFAFLGPVAPQGGGTLVLSGSPALVDRYRQGLDGPVGSGRANWRRFLGQHPWLARLLDGASLPGHGRPLVGATSEIEGQPVAVLELTGAPGDVVVTHQHLFHARSPNTAATPRLMLAKEVHRDATVSL
jgi:hypothetical protein